MLNTDAHNPQVKKRMTKVEFLKNNRGIDEGKDLLPALLEGIYDEIQFNEIKMKGEVAGSNRSGSLGGGGSVSGPGDHGMDGDMSGDEDSRSEKSSTSVGNRVKDKVVKKKKDSPDIIGSKTEAMFAKILKRGAASKRSGSSLIGGSKSDSQDGNWFMAFHHEHVKGMFQIVWMSILTGLAGPLQESEDIETIALTLEGFKYAIRIISTFDLELERKAFVGTLSKFTLLTNLSEMKVKNVEGIKCLLEIAYTEGNWLNDSWLEVVKCVSSLERLNLIGAGSEMKR